MIRRIVVSGGGIGGLTAAIALNKVHGVEDVVVVEKSRLGPRRAAPASGIALWRNSLQVYRELGLLEQLEAKGSYMRENIGYYDELGAPLAKAPNNFHHNFPILCLHREDLQTALMDHLEQHTSTRFLNGVGCEGFAADGDQVAVGLSSGDFLNADLLIGADGLHSRLREAICPAPVQYCGYTYYRATLNKQQLASQAQDDLDAYMSHSFESWGTGKRFGYVPLRDPTVFWFASIPSPPLDTDGRFATQAISQVDVEHLKEHFRGFRGPIDIPQLIAKTEMGQILRTDIHKVPVLGKWSEGRVVLLGDAVHATSPNLAQGAGLAIEDALQLAAALQQVNRGHCSLPEALQNYQDQRVPRAEVVQSVADMIAMVGQLPHGWATVRNFVMKLGTNWAPPIQKFLFEKTVEFSLARNWKLPLLTDSCLWERVIGKDVFAALPAQVQRFRQTPTDSGMGTCTVEYFSGLGKLLGRVLQFPRPMEESPFLASVAAEQGAVQRWTRVFGYGTQKELTYSTAMSTDSSGQTLVERKWTSEFHYDIRYDAGEKQLMYSTKAFYLLPGVRMWKVLSPYSEWTETPTPTGWRFDGFISLPLVGKVFRYHGDFAVNQTEYDAKQ